MKVAEPLVLVQLAKFSNNLVNKLNKPASEAGFFLSLYKIYDIFLYMEEINNTDTTNIKRESVNGLSNITYAGLFPRFVALIVDLAITALVFAGLLLFTQNVICKNSSYVKNAQSEFYSYNVDSGLYDKLEDGTLKEKTFDNYRSYQDLFYSYYTDYLVNKCPEQYRVSYNDKEVYWFNTHVLGQKDELSLYDDIEKLDDLVKNTGPALFTYQLDGENNPLYDQIALPKCQNNDAEATISDADQAKLIKYFYISDADNKNNETCYYSIASLDLVNREFVSNAYNVWYQHYYQLPIIFCLAFSMIIFFFVIPMFFKNGETLGKLIFHLGIVNKLGYRYSRLQLIPRYFAMMAIVVAMYLIFGISFITLGILTFLALGSYGLAIFTKNHKAIHDFIAGTIVVNKVHSEIYKDANEEAKIKASIQEVKPLLADIETPREETLLYKNENFEGKKNDGDKQSKK